MFNISLITTAYKYILEAVELLVKKPVQGNTLFLHFYVPILNGEGPGELPREMYIWGWQVFVIQNTEWYCNCYG